MKIVLKRFRRTRWGLDGKLYVNGHYTCDTTEHPRKRLPPGTYLITKEYFLFNRKNGPMANANGEISVGKLSLPGVLIQTHVCYGQLYKRIRNEWWHNRKVLLEIS